MDTGLQGVAWLWGEPTKILGSRNFQKHPWRLRVGGGEGCTVPLGPLPSPGPPSRMGVQSPPEATVAALGGGPGTPGEVWGESLPCPQPTLEGHQLRVAAPNAEGRGRWGKPSALVPLCPRGPSVPPGLAAFAAWALGVQAWGWVPRAGGFSGRGRMDPLLLLPP